MMNPRNAFRLLAAVSTAAFLAACGDGGITLPDERAASDIEITGGTDQTAPVGTTLPTAIAALVTDAQGRPVVDQRVEFSVSGGGSAAPAAVQTDAAGIAETQWTLGTAAGTQTLTARPVGNGAADVSATVQATAAPGAPATLAMVSGDDQQAVAGTTLPNPLVVEVNDQHGNPVPGVAVAWTVTGGGTVSEELSTTDAEGRSSVTRTLGTSTGEQGAEAAVEGLDGSPVAFTATSTVGSAGRLAIDRQPSSSAQSGVVLGTQPRVQLQDASGNDVAQAGTAIEVTLSGPAGGTLLGTPLAATNASGLASFTNLAISGPAGEYRLNFSGANLSLTGVTSGPINVGAGAAAALRFVDQPSNTQAGSTMSSVRVEVVDAQGNRVTGDSRTISLQLQNANGATLSGTTSRPAQSGVATFNDLSISQAGSGYRLAASATGVTGAQSSTFTITPGQASNIAKTQGDGQTGTVGTELPLDPRIRVTDNAGNPVSGLSVTFTPSGNGSVTGGTTATNGNGEATVGSWTLGTAAGQQTLTATVSGVGSVQFTATAEAAAPSELEFTTPPPASVESGSMLTPAPVVRVADQYGNPIAGVSVIVSISGGATLGGTTQQTTSGTGQAGFPGVTVTAPAADYTLTFTAGSLTVTSQLAVTAGGASEGNSSVGVAPGTVEAGSPATVTVVARDASNNPIGGAGVSLVSSPGTAVFGSTTLTTNGAGVATTSFSAAATGAYEITATITPPSGGPLDVAGTVDVIAAATSTAITGHSPEPSAPGEGVTVSFSVTSGLPNPVGSVTVTSTDGASCSANTALGSCTITFTQAGTWDLTAEYQGQGSWAGSTSPSVSHVVEDPGGGGGEAMTVEIRRQPSATASSGEAFRDQPEVRIRDAAGNNLGGVPVSVSLASGPGVLGGRTDDVSRGNGVASWDDLRITGAGVHLLRFSAGSASAVSTPVVVLP